MQSCSFLGVGKNTGVFFPQGLCQVILALAAPPDFLPTTYLSISFPLSLCLSFQLLGTAPCLVPRSIQGHGVDRAMSLTIGRCDQWDYFLKKS